MKRFIVILLVIQVLLLTGCTLPLIGDITGSSGQEQQMLTAPADTLQEAKTDDPQGSRNAGIMNALTNGLSTSFNTPSGSGILNGSLPGTQSAIGLETSPGAIGESIASSVSSETASDALPTGSAVVALPTGTAVAGEVYQTPEEVADQPETAYSAEEITPAQRAVQDAVQESEQGTVRDVTETGYPVTVYYQDGDGCLVPMTRWIQRQQGIARAAVSLGIDNPIAREEIAYYGVYPVIPAETQILGLNILEGIAVIDFDKRLFRYSDAKSERNIVAAIVYTLTEFRNIDGVRILVNGYPQEALKYGTDVSGILDRENTAINASLPIQGGSSAKTDVFLLKKANEGFTYVVPVSVPIRDASGEVTTDSQKAELLVRQLASGNFESNAFSEIPTGAKLLACTVEDGTLTLDFGDSFVNYGGTEKEESMLKQLAYTIRQVDGIRRVRIKVGGQPVQLPEGTDISQGLAIPATINDVMDR